MPQSDHQFVRHGVTVDYKRRPAQMDRRHLVVVFTGLKPLDFYDFSGRSTEDNQANWLWLKDKFDDYYAYYVCRNMDFAIERAVIDLIDEELDRLGLTRNECTLLGVSKGGFSALYFGIKYNFRNIVANAPQIYVGTHTRNVRPKIFAHMAGDGGDREHELLDALIPDAVAADEGTDKNIYLFSSPDDQFHQAQIAPALPMFAKYKNFNYFETGSDLVWEHAGVIRYNLPLVLSILHATSENAPPWFGAVRNGNRPAPELSQGVLARQQAAVEPVANLAAARLTGAGFFPEGVGFLRGHAIETLSAQSTTLVLAAKGVRREYPMVAAPDPALYFRYYQDAFCNYKRAKFITPKNLGLDLSDLPAGTYRLQLRLAIHGVEAEAPLCSANPVRAESHQDGRLYRLRSSAEQALLDVRPAVGREPGRKLFRVRKSWARGPLMHLDGDFAVRGVEMPDRRAGRYYLVLRGTDGTVHTRALVVSGLDGMANAFGDGVGDYSAARFGTPKRAGVDVSSLPAGEYDVAVTLSAAGGVYTVPAGKRLRISIDDAGAPAASLRNWGAGPVPALKGLRSVPAAELRRRLKRRVRRRLSQLLPR